MTSINNENSHIAAIFDRFRAAALLYQHGLFLRSNRIESKGLDGIQAAKKELDALGPDGRRELIPLLDDPDPGIRVMATPYVYPFVPERVLAVLNEIDKNCETDATMTAFHYLNQIERGAFRRP